MSKNNNESLNEGLFGTARKFTDAFFDGLKSNAINHALANAKKSERLPTPIKQKMDSIQKLSKELEQMIKDYES